MGAGTVLDVEKIRQLVEMMVTNDLVEISLRDGEVEVNLRRPNTNGPVTAALPEMMMQSAARSAAPAAGLQPIDVNAPDPKKDDGKFVEITSPMVGTFYAGSDPESPPFVLVGSEIHVGTVVCILEAMKVFNEIKSEIAGRIERILIKNAQPVEYGQPLFLVHPL